MISLASSGNRCSDGASASAILLSLEIVLSEIFGLFNFEDMDSVSVLMSSPEKIIDVLEHCLLSCGFNYFCYSIPRFGE